MNFVKWLIGGVVAGAVGAAVWGGITYATNMEIGIVAWGIGLVVGVGVRMAAGNDSGVGPGVTAVLIAAISIAAGKYFAVHLIVNKALADDPNKAPAFKVTADEMINSIAVQVMEEKEKKGEKIEFPKGKSKDDMESAKDIPPGIMAEAKKRWEELGAEGQQAKIKEQEEEREKLLNQLRGMVAGGLKERGFKESFSPFDILWFILAAMTAYRIGSGAVGSD